MAVKIEYIKGKKMNKQNELTKEQRDEKNILIANVMDKVRFVKERSGFENTFFLI